MSSFYGNIKFNNQTPLIFDKTYPSRSAMEQNCHSDGILHGRYILISYGDIQYTPYHSIGRLSRSAFEGLINAGNTLYVIASGEGANSDGFMAVTSIDSHNDDNEYFVKTTYAIDNTSEFTKNQRDDLFNYHHEYHNTVWQKVWTSTQDSNEIEEKYIMVSHLNAETPKLTMIVDAPSDSMEKNDINNIGYFLVPTDQAGLNVPGRMTRFDYSNNKDSIYIKTDSGFELAQGDWDIGTDYYVLINGVYRKVTDSNPYEDGMISEQLYIDLVTNRNIPLYVASNEPGKYNLANGWQREEKYYFMRYRETHGRPHFDPIMSTDLEYLFHMPRNWKFNNETNFDYNDDGFKKEQASNTHAKDNYIQLLEESSEDFYPVHRTDEPSAGLYNENQELILKQLPDTKKFDISLRKIGDVMSEVWDIIYPKNYPNLDNSTRNLFIGNDRDPENPIDYPGTVAEAVRKLYYWLGIKTDNNFVQGPWVNPETGEEVDTIFGVLNGASDLLGSFGDTFNDDQFIPIASPYYPNGFGHYIDEEEYTQLTLEEFNLLNDGGAGPLYIKKDDGSYEQATDYDYNEQYYRNMNSLLALLRAWQDIVKDTQADWTYDVGHVEWNQNNPLHPRFIRNKPMVLTVDLTAKDEGSINWYWKNYAI